MNHTVRSSSRMLRAVRSALIAADSAGSALFRTHEEYKKDRQSPGQHIRRWIDDAFNPAANRLDDVEGPMRRSSTRGSQTMDVRTIRPFPWNEFQEACADPASCAGQGTADRPVW